MTCGVNYTQIPLHAIYKNIQLDCGFSTKKHSIKKKENKEPTSISSSEKNEEESTQMNILKREVHYTNTWRFG